MGKTVTGKVGAERLRRIQEVLNKLEHKEKGKDKENLIGNQNLNTF